LEKKRWLFGGHYYYYHHHHSLECSFHGELGRITRIDTTHKGVDNSLKGLLAQMPCDEFLDTLLIPLIKDRRRRRRDGGGVRMTMERKDREWWWWLPWYPSSIITYYYSPQVPS